MLASRARALLDGRLAPSVDDVVALARAGAAPPHGAEFLRPRRRRGAGRRHRPPGRAHRMSGAAFLHARRAEALADRLPPLLVAAERVAATVAQGVHGRRRVGQGDSFWQFRRFAGRRRRQPHRLAAVRPALRPRRSSAKPSGKRRRPSAVARRRARHALALAPVRHREDRACRPAALALAALLLRGGERVSLLAPGARTGLGPGRAGPARPGPRAPARADEPACRRRCPSPPCQRGAVRRLPLPAGGDPGHGRPPCRRAGQRAPLQILDPAETLLPYSGPHPLQRPGERGRNADPPGRNRARRLRATPEPRSRTGWPRSPPPPGSAFGSTAPTIRRKRRC